MKKIAIQAYNNTDWLCDTDFIILTLTNEQLEDLKLKQSQLKELFPNDHVEIHSFNYNYDVYSANVDRSYLNDEIMDWLDLEPNKRPEYIILKDDSLNYDIIPTSEEENDIRLDTYMIVLNKIGIFCKLYTKYSGDEIYTNEININKL